jgi:hypothetical protein
VRGLGGQGIKKADPKIRWFREFWLLLMKKAGGEKVVLFCLDIGLFWILDRKNGVFSKG